MGSIGTVLTQFTVPIKRPFASPLLEITCERPLETSGEDRIRPSPSPKFRLGNKLRPHSIAAL